MRKKRKKWQNCDSFSKFYDLEGGREGHNTGKRRQAEQSSEGEYNTTYLVSVKEEKKERARETFADRKVRNLGKDRPDCSSKLRS